MSGQHERLGGGTPLRAYYIERQHQSVSHTCGDNGSELYAGFVVVQHFLEVRAAVAGKAARIQVLHGQLLKVLLQRKPARLNPDHPVLGPAFVYFSE